MTDAKNRKLRQALGKRWQDQPRKPDYRPVALSLEHGIVEPTDRVALSLNEPEDAA